MSPGQLTVQVGKRQSTLYILWDIALISVCLIQELYMRIVKNHRRNVALPDGAAAFK